MQTRYLLPIALVAALATVQAHAGRPLSTEDASVLEEKRCQLESWIDRSRDATAGWLVPACNFGAGIEWQAGFARAREDGSARFSEAYVQAKRVFIEPEAGRTGVALVVGTVRRPQNEVRRGWQNPYVLVPFTHPLGEAAIHANVGWSRDAESRRNLTLWGVAFEAPMGERVAVVAEAFGENRERPFVRAGFRWTAIPEVLDFDLTAVARPGGERSDRYISFGFTVVTAPFLP